jgi:hypothetical protein
MITTTPVIGRHARIDHHSAGGQDWSVCLSLILHPIAAAALQQN